MVEMENDRVRIGDANIATIGALMGEPARAKVLMALLDGRALAASTLAAEAGVAASTLSTHLSRLVDGDLVSVETSGRNRYFRITRPEVADALEALARLAPAQPIRSLRQGTHAEAIRRARTCYDHLAGRLGVALLDALVDSELLLVDSTSDAQSDPILGLGRAKSYILTPVGKARLETLGVALDRTSRRTLTRYCLDWSEQRAHLGGALGANILTRLLELGWLVRGERRIVKVTATGHDGLEAEFGIAPDTWD
jgi:DNA-binding transcriptional ArsR family regulator